MTADPYAHLDAAYLLGALDADGAPLLRGAPGYLLAMPGEPGRDLRDRALLAGLDESVFATPPEAAPTPVPDTIALQPRPWGTEIDLTSWYQRGAAEPPSERYELVAHGAAYDLGSWQLTPAGKSSLPATPHSSGHRSRTSRSPQPNGARHPHVGVARLFRTADH
jgi:hypothetical protein